MQVVEAGFRIVIIPPVAEGVVIGHMRGGGGNGRPRRVAHAQHLPERVVGVLRHQGPRVAPAACVAAVDGRQVPLQVFGEIVVRLACLRRILQPKPNWAPALVVQVPQGQAHAARGGKAPLPYRQTVYDVVRGTTRCLSLLS